MKRSVLLIMAILASLAGIGIVSAQEFGTAWSEQGTDALPAARRHHSSVVFDDQLWVIGGISSGGTVSEKVYASADGPTWAEVGVDVLPDERYTHCSLVFNDQMWVIGGYDQGNVPQETVYATSDGTTWAEVGVNALPAPLAEINQQCVVFNSMMWVFGGVTTGSVIVETVYNTSDGITWTEVGTNALPQATRFGAAVVASNRLLFIGGQGTGATVFDTVYSSLAGESWSQIGTLPGDRRSGGATVADGRIWVIGGFDGVNDADTLFASADSGENWTEIGQNLTIAVREHSMAFFNGRLFHMGGVSAGLTIRKVFATDDIAGLTRQDTPSGVASEMASPIGSIDQSADAANSALPIIEIVAGEEAETGWPLVDLTLTILFVAFAIMAAGAVAKLAPESKLLGAITIMGVLLIGFVVGQGAIPWYVLLASGGLMFGIVSLGSSVQG